MRGVHQVIHNLSNKMMFAALAVFGAFAFAAVPLVGQTASAASNDIVNGGIWNRDLASKCHGDVETIMKHYRINCDLPDVVDGRACKDGNVYVGDRVVARDSRSIGRNPIQGSRPISIGGQTYYETHNSQALLQNCLDAFVKLDGNGSFTYAIIKACGNPIWTPSPVVNNPPREEPPRETPTPKPTKKYKYVCELATGQRRYVSEETAKDTDKYGPYPCPQKEEVEVCIIAKKVVDTVSEAELKKNPSKYSKDLSKCEDKPLTVCDLDKKEMVEISQAEYDKNKSKYSTNPEDCEEEPAPNPKGDGELPQTGIGDHLLGGGIGLGSLIVAGSAYISSRKDWIAAILNR